MMHPSTYEYLKPTDEQLAQMARVRAAAKAYSDILDAELPEGPDKTFVLRAHRSNAMSRMSRSPGTLTERLELNPSRSLTESRR